MPRVTAPLSCSICLNDDSHNNDPWTCLMPCGHIFHLPCVREWASPAKVPGERRRARKPNNTCPACRHKIHRPEGSSGSTCKQLSRFTKIIFGGDVQASLTSSSPVKQSHLPAATVAVVANGRTARDRLVIRDTDDERSGSEIGELLSDLDDGDAPVQLRAGQGAAAAAAAAGNNGGGGLTESESDGENVRPARAVYAGPGRRAAHLNDNIDAIGQTEFASPDDGETPSAESAPVPVASTSRNALRDARELREARATIRAQDTRLQELAARLEEKEQDLADAITGRTTALAQQAGLQQVLQGLKRDLVELEQRLKDVTSEKSSLSKTLKHEVDTVQKLKTSNEKTISELAKLQIKHESLSAKYKDLNVARDNDQARLAQLEKQLSHHQETHVRLRDANAKYCRLLANKKIALDLARSDLAAFRDPAETKRLEKGKMREFRAMELDDAAVERIVDAMSDVEAAPGEGFVEPGDRQTSGSTTNGHSRKHSGAFDATAHAAPTRNAYEEQEESLIVEEVPDSQDDGPAGGGRGKEGSQGRPIPLDDFGDLDIMPGEGAGYQSGKNRNKNFNYGRTASLATHRNASLFSGKPERKKAPLVRDPLREQTNSPGRKRKGSTSVSSSKIEDVGTSASTSTSTKKRPLSALNSASASASGKWVDMALFPRSGSSKSGTAAVFVGEKKKIKTGF